MTRPLSRLPASYENFSMLRELATRLCWDKQLDRGFTQLEHAGYILSALNARDMGGEMTYLGEAADITDDMCCLSQLLGRNGDACKYQNLRLQTLTSQECPLECFVDPKHLDADGDEILVLRDAYSAMAALCIENGAEMQREGKFSMALACLNSTYDFLRNCSLFSQNHIQVANVRRNLASVFRDMKRTQEADQYDALLILSNNMEDNALENRPYYNFKKIFFRPRPGGVPTLYLPSGAHIGGADENKVEIEKLARKLLGLQNGSEKKKTSKKAPKTNTEKAKDVRGIPATYSNFVMLRDLAKKLCWEKQYMKAFYQLEHAVHVLQAINFQHGSVEMIHADKAADVLDDMACIMQLLCDYKKAYMYLMIRLQTLTGIEDPLLEDFVAADGDNLVLSDTHSAMFTILKLQAVRLENDGKLSDALEALESALQMLHRCLLISDNHLQIASTRRHIASVLRKLKRGAEADVYDKQSVTVNFNIAALKGPYTEKDKIFFRPIHGGAPELYMPGPDTQEANEETKKVSDVSADAEAGPAVGGVSKKKAEHAFQCLKSLAAMEYIRKKEDSEKAMQELLEEEEADKKRAAENVSKKTKKKAVKTKQAKEKKQEGERVVEVFFREQKQSAVAKTFSESESLATSLLPLRLSPGPVSPIAVSSPSLSCSPVLISPVVSLSPDSKESEMDSYFEHFLCPISLEIMEDPVMTVDGSSYERASIEAWFQKTDRDPLTNEIVTSKALIPNKALKSAIQAARELRRVWERGSAVSGDI